MLDYFRDRIRTPVNVIGDAVGAAIVYHMSRDELEEMDRQHRLRDEARARSSFLKLQMEKVKELQDSNTYYGSDSIGDD